MLLDRRYLDEKWGLVNINQTLFLYPKIEMVQQ
jgi:hypothetical protein